MELEGHAIPPLLKQLSTLSYLNPRSRPVTRIRLEPEEYPEMTAEHFDERNGIARRNARGDLLDTIPSSYWPRMALSGKMAGPEEGYHRLMNLLAS